MGNLIWFHAFKREEYVGSETDNGDGETRRGRPRLQWLGDVGAVQRALGLSHWREVAVDRSVWRRIMEEDHGGGYSAGGKKNITLSESNLIVATLL